MGSKIIQFLVQTARIIVGGLFVFSGFVKAIDPLGTVYQIHDYLISLNLTLFFPLALPGAIGLLTAEIALGVFLLLGIYRKFTVFIISLMMIFFTPFTLWVAMTNPVSDCGCFGDALVISNWQTFYKNIVLLACIVFLIWTYKRIKPLFSKEIRIYVAGFVTIFALLFTLYNLHRLPILDFRPYRIGANIPEKMRIDPENMDILETILIYRKDGVEQAFTQDDFPWDDPAWEFVRMENRLVRAGERPQIEQFVIESLYHDQATGRWVVENDITDIILSEPRYTFLMVSPSLNRVNARQLRHFEAINRYAQEHGYLFYLLTSSPLHEVGEWESRHRTGFRFLFSDERILITMIRSNPGLILLREGTVVNNWAASQVSEVSRLTVPLSETRLTEIGNERRINILRLLIVGLLFFIPLLIFKWID